MCPMHRSMKECTFDSEFSLCRSHFAAVRADKILLIATVITTATYIVDRDSHRKVGTLNTLGLITLNIWMCDSAHIEYQLSELLH